MTKQEQAFEKFIVSKPSEADAENLAKAMVEALVMGGRSKEPFSQALARIAFREGWKAALENFEAVKEGKL